MPDALYCGGKMDLLTFALKQAPPGLALEFGVFKGTTINHLARQAPDRRFYGFDSFTGLPDTGRARAIRPSISIAEARSRRWPPT